MISHTHVGTLDPVALGAAFTRVYENYAVPLQMTPEWLARHIDTNDVDRGESPLWLDQTGGVVALGLLGIRGAHGWIGGFGVALEHRGRGISRELVRDMLERATARGLSQVQLEVLAQNEVAIRTYLGAGFETRRDLIVYIRPTDAAGPPADAARVREADPDALLRAAIETHGENALAGMCWQREPASLLGRGGFQALTLAAADPAFIIYDATPKGVRIAALRAHSDEAIASLLAALVGQRPAVPVSVLNEPEDSPHRNALEVLGFVERLRQREMVVPVRA